ncbi:DUF4386 domain-containing protein [Kribbella shirazensis]|uniref:DUF4386 domain-containing protein n=1 Tax=Kribbella shirazensis TaxID=1105143 RepID=A0A7X5V4C7_9ACTN|nr:DUF4386 domain-containing protein [Kribbella shirazensis]NIK54342.1 hypothetical protein [Kribbella shirazensis]
MTGTEARHQAPPGPSLAGAREITALRQAGLVAGVGILAMAVLSGFGIFYVGEGLMTPGDTASTVEDIAASDGLFRWGTASLYAVVVLDVVVAWALFRFLRPVSSGLARLAAWFRLAYAGVFMLAIGQLAGIPDLVASDQYSSLFTAEQIQGQTLLKIDAFDDLWMAGLILFGIHLTLVGYLAYRSGYVPKLLGVLLVIAGAGYVFDSLASTVLASPPGSVATVTFVGEFLLALWLVARGRRISLEADGHGL